jgi:hypothetical protein
MDYELANQLKEAGFPFLGESLELGDEVAFGLPALKGKLLSIEHGTAKVRVGGLGVHQVPDYTLHNWRVPTLEELIEACRPRFFSLVDNVRNWRAQSQNAEFNTEGSTPEEAVAQLWLALNKK